MPQSKPPKTDPFRIETRLTHDGRNPEAQAGAVNPPAYRMSTVTFPTVAALAEGYANRFDGIYYGRYGTPTSQALEEVLTALEGVEQGPYRTMLTSSGMAAIAGPLLALLNSGDHLLMIDSVYGPTRAFCDTQLNRFGIETTYYAAGDNLAPLFRDNTRLVFCESPGSLTFEIQDLPQIADIAHARDCLVAVDNTWATGLYYRPLHLGADISVQAATKYIVGHSDAMLGAVTCSESLYRRIKPAVSGFGYAAGSEECWLGLRGVRTLAARLRQHQENALKVADWLAAHPNVDRVLYPARPEDTYHDLWRRDFTGASGLFGAVLKLGSDDALAAMLDGLALFGMGYSWGGFESLVIPADRGLTRTARPWNGPGPLIRLHIGLENPDDLIADLAAGLDRYSRS